MNNKTTEELAWSVYWSQDRLDSCVASEDSGRADLDQQTLVKIWMDFANRLPENCSVLDVATGNGTVPVALMSARDDLNITGIDQADIDPPKYVSNNPELASVSFLSNTDILNWQGKKGAFCAICSQFGIEYAGLTKATEHLLPTLSDDGQIEFIVHHKESELVKSSMLKHKELEQLVQEGGLLDCLLNYVRGEAPIQELESMGQGYLQSEGNKTSAITGQFFNGINQVIEVLSQNKSDGIKLAAVLSLRLTSEYQRLTQMGNSAQTEQQMSSFVEYLKQSGLRDIHLSKVYAGEGGQQYLLAWQLFATK